MAESEDRPYGRNSIAFRTNGTWRAAEQALDTRSASELAKQVSKGVRVRGMGLFCWLSGRMGIWVN